MDQSIGDKNTKKKKNETGNEQNRSVAVSILRDFRSFNINMWTRMYYQRFSDKKENTCVKQKTDWNLKFFNPLYLDLIDITLIHSFWEKFSASKQNVSDSFREGKEPVT